LTLFIWSSTLTFLSICSRILPDGTCGQSVKTRIDLPMLRPPGRVSVNNAATGSVHEEGDQNADDDSNSIGNRPNINGNHTSGLVALLQVPAIGKLHKPMNVLLIVRNESLGRTANVSVSVGMGGGSGSGEAEGEGGAAGASGSQQLQQFALAGIKNGRLGVVLPGEEVRVEWVVVPLECGYLRVPKVKVLDWRGGGGGEGEEVEIFDFGKYAGREIGSVDDVGSVLVLP
jgi:hypothetical protein